MNYKLLVATAVLTGEIMLMSGAETYRVEDTISRILKISGDDTTQAFVSSTGIVVSITNKESDSITVLGKVSERNTNLNKIFLANNISRKLCKGELTIEDAYEELQKINKTNEYPNIVIYMCIIITTTFFTVRIGGSFLECIFSAWNGCIIVGCEIISEKIKLNKLVTMLFTSFLIAFTTVILCNISKSGYDLERIISSSIMPMVPGVAITNAVRDTLQGDCVSGGARIIDAFVLATIIAAGIGGGFLVYSVLSGVTVI